MRINFNFVFADFNLHNGNGYTKEKSAFYNWIFNNSFVGTSSMKDNLSHRSIAYNDNRKNKECITNSVSSNYTVDEDVNNLFLLECKQGLRDIFEFDLTENIKNLLRNKQMKIIVSSLSEPTTFLNKFENEFEKFCKQEEISVDSFIFVDSNFNIEKCDKIRGYYCLHLLVNGGWDAKQILLGKDKSKNHLRYIPSLPTVTEARKKIDRDHYFISFNRGNNKFHRVLFGCYFIEKNDDRILWSYLIEPEEGHGFEYLQTSKQKKLYSDNIEKLKDIVPKQIDTHEAKKLESFSITRNYDKDKLSLNNYFDIVTESEYTHQNDNVIYVSDKIVRPIVNLHPFIVVSTPGYLKHLQQLGFKTYDDIFDESYDDITDHSERLDFIMNEIDKILLKSPEEVKSLYEENFDICVYNRDYLFNNLSLFEGSEFEELFYSGIIPNEYSTYVIPTIGTSKISIAQHAKMGSSTLDRLASSGKYLKSYPYRDRKRPNNTYPQLKSMDGITNHDKVIILLRDSLAKWKSGYFMESMHPGHNGWRDIQHRFFDVENEVSDIFKDKNSKLNFVKDGKPVDPFSLTVEKFIPSHGVNSDLSWMAANHGEFSSWCGSHHSTFSTVDPNINQGKKMVKLKEHTGYFSLLDLSKISNVYFVELKDLSNPKLLKWLQSEDENWNVISKIPHENNVDQDKEQFWEVHDFFWNNYQGSDLVNPFYDLPGNELNSDIKRWLKLVKSDQLVIDDIRKNHPRYKDFL